MKHIKRPVDLDGDGIYDAIINEKGEVVHVWDKKRTFWKKVK